MGNAPPVSYVFGYGSLVRLDEPLVVEKRSYPSVPGHLHGFRREWGAAMNNWEATEAEKHFIDPENGEKPHIRVAYLDIRECEGGIVNGLAIPADASRIAELDQREVNYLRIDVSASFRPSLPYTVYTYRATAAARERCRAAAPDVHVSREYISLVRAGFARLGEAALREYERTTDPLRFPERDLELRYPLRDAGDLR